MGKNRFIIGMLIMSTVAQASVSGYRDEGVGTYRTIKGDLIHLGSTPSEVMSRWQMLSPLKGEAVVEVAPGVKRVAEGVSADKAYATFKVAKKMKEVIVAVVDSGVDIRHPDLKGKLWVNAKEIPNNNRDDDKNGYVDDIFGWNFIGSSKAQAKYEDTDGNWNNGFTYVPSKLADSQVTVDTLEVTREYKKYKALYDAGKLTAKELEYYNEVKAAYDAGVAEDPSSPYYDLTLNTRDIVGDDYSNTSERTYGNNDVIGDVEGSSHGTHVSGIIAAVQGNHLGMDGIAQKVRIMAVRVVPDGDERDKDVANGIRYAVDNGAKVINMSFGKGFSPYKNVVDEAMKYAVSKGVILVHAAGNSAQNNDDTRNYPNRFDLKNKSEHSLWIEVGASTVAAVPYTNTRGSLIQLPAYFSNFGHRSVDVFAPGYQIYSSVPDEKYDTYSGTSMASPVVAGVVAALKGFSPTSTPEQIRSAILSSVKQYPSLLVEHAQAKREFAELSKTGGIVDLFKAASLLPGTCLKKKVFCWL
jgi:subtilisin family serine protease